jgi:hypothetical protein
LQQEVDLYHIYQPEIAECDTALCAHLQTLEGKAKPDSKLPPTKANKKAGSNAQAILICGESYTESADTSKRKYGSMKSSAFRKRPRTWASPSL